MDAVYRGAIVYVLILFIFRLAGRRTLAQMTTFDLVLLLIISEATQNAMIGDDPSITNAMLVIISLVSLDIGLSLVKRWSPLAERWLEGRPLIVVEHGRSLTNLMKKARIDEADVMTAARDKHGLERMSQIKYAVLETNGQISIIPEPADSSSH
jgi:uncharacterized membrane protein YcaP (DUF421 family)